MKTYRTEDKQELYTKKLSITTFDENGRIEVAYQFLRAQSVRQTPETQEFTISDGKIVQASSRYGGSWLEEEPYLCLGTLHLGVENGDIPQELSDVIRKAIITREFGKGDDSIFREL